jgi:opacity protein-like surface antigen
MTPIRLGAATSLGLLLLASPGRARASEELNTRIGFGAGGSASIPLSNAAGRFWTGTGVQVALGYELTRRLSLQTEFFYSTYPVKANLVTASGLQATHQMRQGGLSALFQVLHERDFGVYAVGGPGLYYRRVSINAISGAPTGTPFCDPWLFTCLGSGTPQTEALRSVSSTDFGLSVGVGATLRYAGPLRAYVEARYHYIRGPKFNTPSGTQRANGMYLPLILGVRF